MAVKWGGRGPGHTSRVVVPGEFVGGGEPASDVVAPVLSLPVGTQTSPTTATVGATTDEDSGVIRWVVTTSSTAPTSTQITNGQDHTGATASAFDFITVGSVGAKTDTATGLTASTAYYAHLVHIDLADNISNIVTSAQFTTAAAPDVTAPVLSLPTATQTGSATADLGVTSDEANGTLYVAVLPSASAAPAAAAFIAGTTGGVYTSSDATPVVGANSFSATGLAASTAYKAHYFQEDAAGNDSNVASSAEFTTTAVVAPVLTQTSEPGTNPMSWSSEYADLILGSDYIGMRWREDGGAWTEETEVLFDSDFFMTYGVDGVSYPWPLFDAAAPHTAGALIEVEEWILRASVRTYSATLSDTMDETPAALPQSGSLALWLEADTADLFQTVDGTTTAVASDADPVGYWYDKTSGSFDLTAPANDTRRPLYKTDGTIHWVRGDGSNDILRRLAALDLWNASGFEACVAIRSQTPGTGATPLAGGNTSSDLKFMSVGFALAADTDNATCFWRNDSGTDILANTTNMMTDLYDEAWHVWQIVDTGSQVTFYRDGVAGATRTYTRGANTITMNNFSLFALLRTSAVSFFSGDIAGMAVWPALNLNSTERGEARTYFGNLVGLTL